ncbi:AAA family ATPase [Fimbriiglobus ruber]|uniref:MoxR protein n=1 Tax=Fimbriiglobus ruber TaxID=1908690 RepID=A0A225ECY6_9BACT|nr:MoxR family ATPase [Fimbriiglobus ruber]OWK46325.1 MoxR protein [Fimbriiglobus ruber]
MSTEAEAEPIILDDNELGTAEKLRTGCKRLLAECGKVIVGQEAVLEQLLLAVLARGHCLLVGVPGLAKTLMIRTLADGMALTFNRVQFTPDLMPTDITGTEILYDDKISGHRGFRFVHGPIFANIVLADEINRTPPKTQAALLEAMQERQVTVAGSRHPLPAPFFVLATQNPIEQEGTYPLPEAQQDRFMFSIRVDYPDEDEEFRIIESTTSGDRPALQTVVSADDILAMQNLVLRVPAAKHVIRYAGRLTRATRPVAAPGDDAPPVPDFVKKYVSWGAGPRAGQNLILAAKAKALLAGRTYVAIEDVRAVALPILRHRVMLNYHAEAEGITPDEVVTRLLHLLPRDERGAK